MPNGDNENKRKYIPKWCDERHQHIEEKVNEVVRQVDKVDGNYKKILYLMIGNLGTLVIGLLLLLFKMKWPT